MPSSWMKKMSLSMNVFIRLVITSLSIKVGTKGGSNGTKGGGGGMENFGRLG